MNTHRGWGSSGGQPADQWPKPLPRNRFTQSPMRITLFGSTPWGISSSLLGPTTTWHPAFLSYSPRALSFSMVKATSDSQLLQASLA